MKVLNVLSAAAVASALPIHANIKLVHVKNNGEKSIETYNNVDLGDSMESAVEALNTIARPHAAQPRISEGGKETLKDIVEGTEDVLEQAQMDADSNFEDLKAQGLENFEDFKNQAKEFVEHAKQYIDETYLQASESVHKIIDSEGKEVEEHREPLEAPKNFKGKHHGRKGGKKEDGAEMFLKSKVDIEEGHKSHKAHKANKAHKDHKIYGLKFDSNGLRPYSRKPCGGPSRKAGHQEPGVVDNMKQWSKGLYEDVSSIDYKQSFSNIAENDDALCAVAAGFLGGVALLTVMTIVAQFLRAKKPVQLTEEEDEEANLMSEKN